MKTNNFDERQLWVRGNAFKHGFILLAVLIVLDSFYAAIMQDAHIFGAMTGVVMICSAVMTTTMELIHKRAYEWGVGGNTLAITILAASTTLAFLSRIYILLKRGMDFSLLETREDLGLCLSMLCIMVFAFYYLYDVMKHKNKEEEESE